MKDTGCIQALDVEWIEIEWAKHHYYYHGQRLYHEHHQNHCHAAPTNGQFWFETQGRSNNSLA